MRHAASQFRSKAERVSVVLNRLDGQVNTMVYAGPAADQFRATMNAERNRLSEIVKALAQVADVLNEGAARVEADPLGYYGAQGAGGAS
jgi:uncharacterized protein YukE